MYYILNTFFKPYTYNIFVLANFFLNGTIESIKL